MDAECFVRRVKYGLQYIEWRLRDGAQTVENGMHKVKHRERIAE